jgi:hypothetical protein
MHLVKALPAPISKEGARRVRIQDAARRRRAEKCAASGKTSFRLEDRGCTRSRSAEAGASE